MANKVLFVYVVISCSRYADRYPRLQKDEQLLVNIPNTEIIFKIVIQIAFILITKSTDQLKVKAPLL